MLVQILFFLVSNLKFELASAQLFLVPFKVCETQQWTINMRQLVEGSYSAHFTQSLSLKLVNLITWLRLSWPTQCHDDPWHVSRCTKRPTKGRSKSFGFSALLLLRLGPPYPSSKENQHQNVIHFHEIPPAQAKKM